MRHCCVDISRMNASIYALPPEIFGLRRLWSIPSISAAQDLLRFAEQGFVSKFCIKLSRLRSNLWRELDFCKICSMAMKKGVIVVESKTRGFFSQLLDLHMEFKFEARNPRFAQPCSAVRRRGHGRGVAGLLRRPETAAGSFTTPPPPPFFFAPYRLRRRRRTFYRSLVPCLLLARRVFRMRLC